MPFAQVALPLPLLREFTYRVPEALQTSLKEGMRVLVPFRRQHYVGVVIDRHDQAPAHLKTISALLETLDQEPIFSHELLSFLKRMARYYGAALGECLKVASPPIDLDTLRRLADRHHLPSDMKLRLRTVKVPQEIHLRLNNSIAKNNLGKVQKEVLAFFEHTPECTRKELLGALPHAQASLRRLIQQEFITTREQPARSDPFLHTHAVPDTTPTLNGDQEQAVTQLQEALGKNSYQAFLLHGVTGSGKTEVYMQVIAEAHKQKRSALVIVPEIALTPQLVSRFRARFGDTIAVLHSGLRESHRFDAWQALAQGKCRIAIGARSALFAPLPQLGVIIVDEEHDASFKQEEGLRYHARDMALLRAQGAKALCILGSATPSLESYLRAQQGKLSILKLPKRATAHPLPHIEVVDLRRYRSTSGNPMWLSPPMRRGLQECLDKQQQAMLYLNRRGFCASLNCSECGEVLQCPSCSVALTKHQQVSSSHLRCHYCDHHSATPTHCPHCKTDNLIDMGIGTEQLEEQVQTLFPQARVARLDRDTASRSRHATEETLKRMHRREIDILVGTQMITKGHDLPGVAFVGVILAEQPLMIPDFRASERMFQILSQVAGRAGRGDLPGRVLLQSYQPQHSALRHAANHDFMNFVNEELSARQELHYPPYTHLAMVRVSAGDARRAEQVCAELAAIAKAQINQTNPSVRVVGPAPAPLTRLRGRYRYRCMLFAAQRPALRRVVESLLQRIDKGVAPARASVDIDPQSML